MRNRARLEPPVDSLFQFVQTQKFQALFHNVENLAETYGTAGVYGILSPHTSFRFTATPP